MCFGQVTEKVYVLERKVWVSGRREGQNGSEGERGHDQNRFLKKGHYLLQKVEGGGEMKQRGARVQSWKRSR